MERVTRKIVQYLNDMEKKAKQMSFTKNLKKEYMKKNPGDYMGEDATKKLKIPKYLTDDEEIVLPKPKND